MIRKLVPTALLVFSALLIGAACAGDDGDDDAAGDSKPSPTATAAATATPSPAATATAATASPSPAATATASPSPAATTAPESEALAALDGLVCTGSWENLTFGSTGSVKMTFEIDDDASGGTVTMEIGGNVFGATGGTVRVPFTQSGSVTTVEADLGFLGKLRAVFEDGELQEATFEAPPALGGAAKVTVSKFVFDGEELSGELEIDFGGGAGTAQSRVDATCS